MMNESIIKKMLIVQKSEMTEHNFYRKIASLQKDEHNKKLLNHIADDELTHYEFWKAYTNVDVKGNIFRVLFYYFIVVLFGLTFGVRLMEKNQRKIKRLYHEINDEIGGIEDIINDENEHETMHINEIDEERLKYIGSIVLGLNDALVEFTGAIAGFTFALASSQLVAKAGLIAGIAASLSMASSEYLATKHEENQRFAIISAFYTGMAYLIAVSLMIFPYFIFEQLFVCLGIMISIVVLIIFLFNYYISIAKELSFKKRFIEMLCISLGVATLSFLIGYLVRNVIGVDV
ncbi:VIT1/CCC1 transporter family protein [Mycoplasmatota bacterium]|nr:VIT1/CCC1 transporter family protein [Mycoplasmatota bacterium]